MPKTQKKRYYNSHDLPLQYAWNIQDTGNYIYMVKDADFSEVDHTEESAIAFKVILHSTINHYGTSHEHLQMLKKKLRFVKMKSAALLETPINTHNIWRANRLLQEIEKVKGVEEKGEREKSLIKIGKFVYDGRMVNAMDMTYWMYYANLEACNKAINQLNALNKTKNGR